MLTRVANGSQQQNGVVDGFGKTHGRDASRSGGPGCAGHRSIGCCPRKSVEGSVIKNAARRPKVIVGGHTHLISIGSDRYITCGNIGSELCPYCPGISLITLRQQRDTAADCPAPKPYKCPATKNRHSLLSVHTRYYSCDSSSGGHGLCRIEIFYELVYTAGDQLCRRIS